VTLEYAYDDWCIARAAASMKEAGIEVDTSLITTFTRRSTNYMNVWDASTGYMRPRSLNGNFRQSFSVLQTHGQGFIEGNAWNYSLYVPHDPAKLISLMGGKKRFVEHLDSLFTMELPETFFEETEDISRDGIIGNYVHGNEPSHHVPYLFNYAGEPGKTQHRVRQIMDVMYRPLPGGLGGNDDCGQMSAWYIFSALGFYPVAPGSDRYDLGCPLVKEATINLENGNKFIISAVNQGPASVSVKKTELNGKKLNRLWITHDEIMKGGRLVFYMK